MRVMQDGLRVLMIDWSCELSQVSSSEPGDSEGGDEDADGGGDGYPDGGGDGDADGGGEGKAEGGRDGEGGVEGERVGGVISVLIKKMLLCPSTYVEMSLRPPGPKVIPVFDEPTCPSKSPNTFTVVPEPTDTSAT